MRFQKILISFLSILLFSTTLTVVPAFAQGSNSSNNNGPFWGLVQFIAQKFGLDENQVKSAVTDYKTQHKQQMQTVMADKEKTRLDKLVSQGKITSSQEQAILSELQALTSKYSVGNNAKLTPQQRKQNMINMQNDLNSWAQTQGINIRYVIPFFGMGMRGHRFGMWPKLSITPTP